MTFPTSDLAAEINHPSLIVHDRERTQSRQHQIVLGFGLKREKSLNIECNRFEVTVGDISDLS